MCFILYLRKSACADPVEELLPVPAAEESGQPENILQAHQKKEKIFSIWHSLDGEKRLLLEQKYILRWSDEELANQLGIQPQSVRMRLTRTKRNLVRWMEEKGFAFTQ